MVPEELIFKRIGRDEIALTARLGRGENPAVQVRWRGQVLRSHRLTALRRRWLSGEHDTLYLDGPAPTHVCLTSGDYAQLYKWAKRLKAQREQAVLTAQAQTRLAPHIRGRLSPLAERLLGPAGRELRRLAA